MRLTQSVRALVLAIPLLAAVSLVACSSDDDGAATPEPTGAPTSEITVTDAWARATPGNPDENSAVYMLITNDGMADDRLIGATVDDGLATTVELHETAMEDGQMRMRQVEGWDVPRDGGTLELAQRANHVMLIGLTKQLVEGDTVGLTLQFEQAGEVWVEASVEQGMPMQMDDDGGS